MLYKIFYRLIIIINIFAYVPMQAGGLVVRQPLLSELESVLELDRRVSFEFFKPLYQKPAYASFLQYRDPDAALEKELTADTQTFTLCICQPQSNQRLLVAFDQQIPLGLIVFHKVNEQSMEIDLLLVDAVARGKGVGKTLVQTALGEFEGIGICKVYPYRFENEATLGFYEKMGFINLGPGPEGVNFYGIPYAATHFHYQLVLAKSFSTDNYFIQTRSSKLFR